MFINLRKVGNKMRIRKRKWTDKELNECKFYIKNGEEFKGKWKEKFNNNNPIHLELGCGKGKFISQLSIKNPNINYIAVDIIDTMLGLAKRNVELEFEKQNKKVNNIYLVRHDVERIMLICEEKKDKVERIYINFCNPWPKSKHKKRRLTYPTQLENYKKILVKNGEIYFKTDDDDLFNESIEYFKNTGFEIVKKTYDLHNEDIFENNIMTEHEEMFSNEGIKIKALIAKYN